MKTRHVAPVMLLCCAFALSLAASPEAQDRPGVKTDTGSGMKEGIQIHGDWTIVVRNADGSVASRHQFKNALDPNGAVYLLSLLARQVQKPQSLRVTLASGAGLDSCGDGAGSHVQCAMRELGETLPISDTWSVPTLSATRVDGHLTLTGSVKTTFAGTIDEVQTDLRSGGGIVRTSNLLSVFTRHALSSPIAVLADQTIDVTVVISFS